MQDGVDAGCKRPGRVEATGIGPRPGIDELAVARPAAVGARPMAGRECRGLVQEEEFAPVTGAEHLAASSLEVQQAGDPGLAAPLRDHFTPVVVDDAAVAGPGAARRHRLEAAHWRDAILQGHGASVVGAHLVWQPAAAHTV